MKEAVLFGEGRELLRRTSKSVRKRSVSVLNFFSLTSRLWEPEECVVENIYCHDKSQT